MRIEVHASLDEIPAHDWNCLAGESDPFLRHEFLSALEHHGCVGAHYGWVPQHLAAYADHGALLGAVPLYLKNNSYGEFVFDWSWADAYQRAGLSYYPKLVVSVPYTPATGPRLLLACEPEADAVADALIEAAVEQARKHRLSSLHWLFTNEADTRRLEDHGLLRRTGCQFHWENKGYRDFDDFLEQFTAAKRKKIKRERRYVHEAGITIERLHGGELSDDQWKTAHEFYRSTFFKHGGIPTLNLDFFREIGRTMGDRVVIVLARRQDRYVASAINLRGTDALYGRHWGCAEEFNGLHFEACYYQGIEYCLQHELRRFEPGAQGEHKISRGFLPTPTWSAHWIAHAGMRRAVADFLAREREGMGYYMQELSAHSPYKDSACAEE